MMLLSFKFSTHITNGKNSYDFLLKIFKQNHIQSYKNSRWFHLESWSRSKLKVIGPWKILLLGFISGCLLFFFLIKSILMSYFTPDWFCITAISHGPSHTFCLCILWEWLCFSSRFILLYLGWLSTIKQVLSLYFIMYFLTWNGLCLLGSKISFSFSTWSF
jgi:hypothetical protein